MDKKLTVLLIEDDTDTCKEFIELFEWSNDLTLLGVTNNSTKAMEYIKDYIPDAIILDLELHQGGGDGLSILNEMQHLSLDARPYVLIATNNSSAITLNHSRKLGADFILAKHQEGYSVKTVLDFLFMMKDTILTNAKKNAEKSLREPPAAREKRIRNRIISELNHVGISPKLKGHQYLIDAIEIVINEPTQNLCNIIGEKYNKTESSVERAIQNAINKAWNSYDIEELLSHYTAKISSEKSVPTITEFVYYYATKIKNDY